MNVAAPIAFALAALALPIVVLYVLKVRLRREPVSTTIFWRKIYEEKSPRSIWQRFRHWVSLLAQLLLLALLVFALTQPYFLWEATQPRRVVLIIDDSASMRAADVAPTRLDAAKELARSAVAGLRGRDEMAVVAAGTQPRVVCGLTGHERTLRDAIDRIQPTDGVTAVPQAIEMARRLLGEAPHGEIVVLTDGRFVGAEALVEDPAVDLRVVGTSAANSAITRFQVRRSLVDPIGYVVLVEAANFSDEAVERRLEIDLDDAPVDVFPLKLGPGEVWSKTIEKVSVSGGNLRARLSGGEDALAADDAAVALLPARERQRVVLVSDANLFLRMAYAANPLVDLEQASVAPKAYDDSAIYVFHRIVPNAPLPKQAFFVDPAEGSPSWQIGGELEDPLVAKQDDDSPLMQHVRLENVSLPKARKLTPAEGATTLAEAVSGEPLYFFHESDGRKALVLSVDLQEGDLAFRTAFPILVTNALGWFAGESGELRESLACGEVADVALPPSDSEDGGSARFIVVSPSDQTLLLPPGADRATFGPIDEAGVWRIAKVSADAVASAEAGELEAALRRAATADELVVVEEVAANLASREESDLRVPNGLAAAAPATHLAAGLGGWLSRPIWLWAAAIALVLFALEWFLYQRRWIG